MKTTHIRVIHSPLAWLAMAMLVLSGTLPAQVIPGRYIAVLKQDTRDTPGAAKALAAQHNLDVDHVYTRALKGFAFNGSEQAAQALARRAEIAYVEPDQIYTAFQQTVPTGIRRSAAAAVPGLIGSGLTVDADVAVIDTGLDGTHPDLNVMPGGVRFYMAYDKRGRPIGVASDSNWQDDNGHGTHVGGIIGALDNDLGVVGVAPGARLWSVKVLAPVCNNPLSVVIAGVDWVVARAAIFEVANMSLGGGYSQAMNDAVKAGTQVGIVFVVAAGNECDDAAKYSPASEPTALTVSALDDNDGRPGSLGGWTEELEQDDLLAWFSNYGEVVDVCAPGATIYSTYLMSKGGYTTMSGTSMATPHVAGAAALYVAQRGLEKNAAGVEAVCAAIRDSGWAAGYYAHFCDFLYADVFYYWTPVALPRYDTIHEPLLNVAGLLYRQNPDALTIQSPADGTKIQGLLTLPVTTTASGATAVQLYVDGQFVGEDAEGADGWTVSWDTSSIADGPRTLVAVATDGATQLAGNAMVVGVNNTSAMVPTVFVMTPYWDPYYADYYGHEVLVSSQLEVTAYAVDLGLVTAVDFYCGETFIGAGVLREKGDWASLWDTTDLPDGIYGLTAVATGADGSQGIGPATPIKIVNQAIHVADLDGVGKLAGGQWQANVWVTIHDQAHNPVAGATVAGTWSVGGAAAPLVTDANGQCRFTTALLKKTSRVWFQVTGVTPPSGMEGVPYDLAFNHDPDGDSDCNHAAFIWVQAPAAN
jgi:subtilisin family serine protease